MVSTHKYCYQSKEFDIIHVIKGLHEAGCIQFGSYKLKSGLDCPYYVDIRELSMKPDLFDIVANRVASIIREAVESSHHTSADSICGDKSDKITTIAGVPYGAVPLASLVSNKLKLPYYPMRKEAKGYGRLISANKYSETHSFVLIEDVMSSGASIEEAIEKLPPNSIKQIFVVVDRQQGGIEAIRTKYPNIALHTMTTVTDILNTLGDNNIIDSSIRDNSLSWLSRNRNSR